MPGVTTIAGLFIALNSYAVHGLNKLAGMTRKRVDARAETRAMMTGLLTGCTLIGIGAALKGVAWSARRNLPENTPMTGAMSLTGDAATLAATPCTSCSSSSPPPPPSSSSSPRPTTGTATDTTLFSYPLPEHGIYGTARTLETQDGRKPLRQTALAVSTLTGVYGLYEAVRARRLLPFGPLVTMNAVVAGYSMMWLRSGLEGPREAHETALYRMAKSVTKEVIAAAPVAR